MARRSDLKSGGKNIVEVKGYTRSNGTYVAGYTRSAPRYKAGSRAGYSNPNNECSWESEPKGYALPDETCIPGARPGYTRAPPQRKACDEGPTSNETFVIGPMQPRADGTKVSGKAASQKKSCSKSSVATSGYSTASSTGSCISGYTPAQAYSPSSYAEVIPGISSIKNFSNSSQGNTSGVQVSPRPTKGKKARGNSVRSNDSDVSSRDGGTGKCYVDNAYNRMLGRVGKPLRTCIVRTCSVTESKKSRAHKKLLEENKLEDLVQTMNGMQATSQPDHEITDEYTNYQYAIDRLHRDEVEESWKTKSVEPSNTDFTSLLYHYHENQIPFADLELEKIIGRGGFGKVYAGCLLGKPIAFKKLSCHQMSLKWKKNFSREVTILASTHHPNIIKMLGFVNEENNIGIVMEYLRCSLYRAVFIDCTLQDVNKKSTIIGQVACALNYLHTREAGRIAHCDIKSENVLLDWSDNALLCDFGLSALKNTASTESSVPGIVAPGQGTPRYSAPEVLRGELLTMTQLLRTDIYSLAIVVFEVMTEEEPFEGLNLKQLEINVGHGTMQPVSDKLSQSVDELLTRCWDRDAASRPTAAEFEEAWREILHE